MRRAFQQKGFTRLFAGLTTSMFGDSVMLLVLSMWVKTLFGMFGGGAVAVVDSLSFLVAAMVIASIPLRESPPQRSEEHWWHEMTGGIKHLVNEPVLRHTLVAFALMLIVIGFTEASIYAVLDFFGKPPTFAGVVVTVQGVGAIVGGVSASAWVRRLGEAGTVTAGMALLALGLAIVALTSTLWVTLAAVVVLGYGLPLTFIAFMTMLQRRTPHGLMGRVSAAVETVMGGPQAVSLAIGALLVTLLDYHVIFAIMAAFTGAAVVYLLICLRGKLFRPDSPLTAAPVESSPLTDRGTPLSEVSVSPVS